MPVRALRPCRHPGCIALVNSDQRYCASHIKLHQAELDQERGTAAQRGYGATWRRLRGMVLHAQPLCVDPFGVHARRAEIAIATDVDHITPRAEGGQDTFENLQALCHACHSRKTAAQSSGWGRGGQISTTSEPETATVATRTPPRNEVK